MILAREQQLRQYAESGDHKKAHDSIDEILALGPHNIHALKWKGDLFHLEGRFMDARGFWRKVLDVDSEDVEALKFFEKLSLEDREAFYFTESTPDGGRRFFMYPRELIAACVGGLLGCSIFLVFTAYIYRMMMFSSGMLAMVSFLGCVALPWLWIVYAYLRTLKEVTVDHEGCCFAYRLTQIRLNWDEVAEVFLAHSRCHGEALLEMIFLPKGEGQQPRVLDLSEHSSNLRARAYFVGEVARVFKSPTTIAKTDLPFACDSCIYL